MRLDLTRRGVLGAGAALGVLALGARPAFAKPGADMVARAQGFLGGLSEGARAEATRGFDDPLRLRWDYMTGSRVSPGLPLERMSEVQKGAALDLLRSGLSEDGFAKAERVMLLQDVLRDEIGKGTADRNRERFSVIVFGTPGEGLWGWRFEGHHLTLNYTLAGDQIVSVTPSSFSSDPNTVASGPHEGTVALQEEENYGRIIFGAMTDKARGHALLQEQSFGNVLALAGKESRIGARRGVPFADLAQAEVDFLMELVDIYSSYHLPGALQGDMWGRLREGDLAAARFGWAGDEKKGSIYYRIHGDTFLIEFATLRNQPQHHHTIRHDFERNLGAHVVG